MRVALMIGLSLTIAAVCPAATWHVAQDGSGDFTVIQDAVDAATDGDVIDIGPGRFDEYQTVYNNGTPIWDVYVLLLGRSLEFVGAGADQTIIGPADADFHPWPGRDVMIVEAQECPNLVFRGIAFEHSPWKIVDAYVENGRIEVSNCLIREGNIGIQVSCNQGGFVRDCGFRDMEDYGVSVVSPTPGFEVSNCTFTNVYGPAAADWSPSHLEVFDCEMDGGRVGVGFYGGATGSVSNCTIRNFINYGVAMNDPGAVTVTGNVIEQKTGWGMALGDADQAVVTQNIIRTETGTCLFFPYPCNGMVFEGNDLDRGNGGFVKTNDYWPYTPPVYFHVQNNYWGTTDAAEIAAHILDGNTMENVNMYVVFEPFSGGPVRVEQRSWGAVRELFR